MVLETGVLTAACTQPESPAASAVEQTVTRAAAPASRAAEPQCARASGPSDAIPRDVMLGDSLAPGYGLSPGVPRSLGRAQGAPHSVPAPGRCRRPRAQHCRRHPSEPRGRAHCGAYRVANAPAPARPARDGGRAPVAMNELRGVSKTV